MKRTKVKRSKVKRSKIKRTKVKRTRMKSKRNRRLMGGMEQEPLSFETLPPEVLKLIGKGLGARDTASLRATERVLFEDVDLKQLQEERQTLDFLKKHGIEIGDNLNDIKELSLQNKQIVDVSPLVTLTSLTKLNLSQNQIVDVSPLTTLTRLQYLDLRGNRIVDVSPLQTLISTDRLVAVVDQRV